MARYILRRILINIPVLIVITILVFIMVEMAPGDMVDFFVTDETEAYLTEEDLHELREKLGLNDPPPVRYLKWMGQLVQGDFGFSYVESYAVGPLLLSRIKNSMLLMGTGLAVAIIFGIPLGIYTALKQYSAIDFTLTGLSFVALSIPAFISGIVGMYIFAVKLGWFSGRWHADTRR